MTLRGQAVAVLGLVGCALSAGCGSKAAACSGAGCGGHGTSTSSAPSTSSSGGAGTGGGGTAGADGGATTSGTGGAPSPNELCVQTGHEGACEMCCDSDNASGYDTYVGALIQDCACTTGAVCYAQCSDPMDLCSDQAAMTGSAACIDCLDMVAKTDPCFTAATGSVNAACAADPSCVALTTCSMGCHGLPM